MQTMTSFFANDQFLFLFGISNLVANLGFFYFILKNLKFSFF